MAIVQRSLLLLLLLAMMVVVVNAGMSGQLVRTREALLAATKRAEKGSFAGVSANVPRLRKDVSSGERANEEGGVHVLDVRDG
jgi:hypothetical protein